MRRLILILIAQLLACTNEIPHKMVFDIVEINVEVFPHSIFRVSFFRDDTAFISNYVHIKPKNKSEIGGPAYIFGNDPNDSIVSTKELTVSNEKMSELNDMIGRLDFKGFAMSNGKNGILDGTIWSLEVKSSSGYQSKIYFRLPPKTSDNKYMLQVRAILEFAFGIHRISPDDLPK